MVLCKTYHPPHLNFSYGAKSAKAFIPEKLDWEFKQQWQKKKKNGPRLVLATLQFVFADDSQLSQFGLPNP